MKNIFLFLLCGLVVIGASGCTTVTPLSKGDIIYWQAKENPLSERSYFVIGKK